MADPSQLSFSVDTHLLRELGALLVGRDSAALLELIKNSYDADATVVTVIAERLGYDDGRIVVSDNGLGMTLQRFDDSFLRIAGRTKETGNRRSPRYQFAARPGRRRSSRSPVIDRDPPLEARR